MGPGGHRYGHILNRPTEAEIGKEKKEKKLVYHSAHWGRPFINSQGMKQGRSCWRLKDLSRTEEIYANLVFEVMFEGESLQLQLKR